MSYVDIIGWIAAAFTLSAYGMKTMLPFRMVAIGANVSFILFGYLTNIQPTMYLHLVLLPFNGFRLWQLLAVSRNVNRALKNNELPDNILSYLTQVEPPERGILFKKGDVADHIYYIKSGTVALDEIDAVMLPGEIFGELAFFSENRKRTLSARCIGDCEILAFSEKTYSKLFFQYPEFGIFMLKLVAQRMERGSLRAEVVKTSH